MTTQSSKSGTVLVWLAGAAFAVVAGVAAYWYGTRIEETPPQQVTAAGEAPQAPAAQPETAPLATESAEAPPDLSEPRFDVLRVEKDGSAVIAGTAPASSRIEILSGDQVIAATTAGPDGAFAAVLDQPLARGDHALTLRSIAPDGTTTVSSETGIVKVPDAGGELMAMVSKNGAPTRITQAPEQTAERTPEAVDEPTQEAAATEPAPATTAEPAEETPAATQPAEETAGAATEAAGEPTEEAAAETSPTAPAEDQQVAAAETEPTEGAASEETAAAEPAPSAPAETTEDQQVAAAEPAPAPGAQPQETPPQAVETPASEPTEPAVPVLVKAVDVDGDRIFVAGSGEPGRRVNVYIDDRFVGTATVGEEGGFLIEATGAIAPGRHEIRADMLADDGAVLSRAAVPLLHEETEVASAENQPAAPAPAEEQKAAAPSAEAVTARTDTDQTAPADEQAPADAVAAAEPSAEVAETGPAAEAVAEAEPAEPPSAAVQPAPPAAEIAATPPPVETAPAEAVAEAAPAAEAAPSEEKAAEAAPAEQNVEETAEAAPSGEVAETAPSGEVAEAPATAQAPATAEAPAAPSEEKVAESAEAPEETAEAPATAQAPATAEAADETAAAAPSGETAEETAEGAPETAEAPAADGVPERSPRAQTAAEQPAQPSERVAAASPEPIVTGASVIIRRGDNLWRISRRMLGAGIKYTVIYEANRDQIRNPHRIYPGQVFDVPGALREMDSN